MQPNYIGVVDPPEYANLRLEALLDLRVEPPGGNLLDGHLGAVDPVLRVPHYRERAGPDLPADQVVADHPVPPR